MLASAPQEKRDERLQRARQHVCQHAVEANGRRHGAVGLNPRSPLATQMLIAFFAIAGLLFGIELFLEMLAVNEE